MKISTWKRKSAPITAALSDFTPIPRGYVRLHDWTVEGFLAESSSFDPDRIFMNAFAMPRYVPTENVVLSYGFRVGEYWDEVGSELASAVVSALPKLGTLATLSGLRASAPDPGDDVNQAELHLGASVIEGDADRFEMFCQRFSEWIPETDWELPVLARCRELITAVRSSSFEAGRTVLRERAGVVDALFQSGRS